MFRKEIIQCLHDSDDDHTLIKEMDKILNKHGDKACKELIHILTHLNLSVDESKECWAAIIAHMAELSRLVGREVCLRTAICDYFCSVNKSLSNPKVIELHIFEKTITESQHDSLTGLFNRHTFDTVLEKEVSRANRYHLNLSVLFFDLDNFKEINDKYGHQFGDLILEKTAEVIKEEKRKEDIASRYGGEELVLILPETDRLDALVLGERIREKIEQLQPEFEGEQITFTISGGLASFPENASDKDSLLKCADTALYQAKGAGKNTVALFSPDKRRFIRIDFSKEIKLKELDFYETDHHTAKSKDISVGGILFQHHVPLHLNTKVELRLWDNNKPLYIIGTVVRVETLGKDKYDIGIAISFLEMDKTTKSEISKYLVRELERGPTIKSLMLEGVRNLRIRDRSEE